MNRTLRSDGRVGTVFTCGNMVSESSVETSMVSRQVLRVFKLFLKHASQRLGFYRD